MVTTGYIERDAQVGALRLHYQEWGSPDAPLILMLHGFGVSGHMFDEFAQRMEARYHLIALDQRGHGDSSWSDEGDYTREAFVADVEGFREALGLDRFVLVGHSMGGLNAVAYTVGHPEHVRALVLVDVGPEAAKEGVDNIVRFTRGPDELDFDEFVEMAHRFNPRRTLDNIRERMRHRLRPLENGKWTWKFDSRFRQEDNGLRIGSELTGDQMWQMYRDVRVPTLLVRGGESDVLTEEVAERAAREMPRTRLVTIAGAGHSVPGDNPDGFTQAVQLFLEDIEEGRFAPAAAAEPPPLDELMEVHEEAARRRRPGALTLVLIGAGAAIALVAGALFAKKGAQSRKRRRDAQGVETSMEAADSEKRAAVDVEQARQRALALLGDVSAMSRDSLARARTTLTDIDLERARAGALEAAQALGERTREAPAAVGRRVPRRRARGSKPGMMRRSAKLALKAPKLLAAGKPKPRKRGLRRLLP